MSFRLTDTIFFLNQNLTTEKELGTYTNSSSAFQRVQPQVSLTGVLGSNQTFTMRLYVKQGSTTLGMTRYTRSNEATISNILLGLFNVVPATTEDASADVIDLAPGESLTVSVQSSSGSDNSIGGTLDFIDAEASITESSEALIEGKDITSTKTALQESPSAADRLLCPRLYLSGLASGAADIDITLFVLSDDLLTLYDTWTYRTVKDPTTIKDALIGRHTCGKYGTSKRLKPILVEAGKILLIGIISSNVGDTAVDVRTLLSSLSTRPARSLFIDSNRR